MDRIKNQRSGGFTMLEVLVSIVVISIGVLGAYSVVQQLFGYTFNSASRLTAAYLAEEGMEIVRNMRDGNWVANWVAGGSLNWLDGLGNCNPNSGDYCEADYTGAITSRSSALAPNVLTSNGIAYGYFADAIPTKFGRKIEIVPSGNTATVTVTVLWQDHGQNQTVTAQGYIYDWIGSAAAPPPPPPPPPPPVSVVIDTLGSYDVFNSLNESASRRAAQTFSVITSFSPNLISIPLARNNNPPGGSDRLIVEMRSNSPSGLLLCSANIMVPTTIPQYTADPTGSNELTVPIAGCNLIAGSTYAVVLIYDNTCGLPACNSTSILHFWGSNNSAAYPGGDGFYRMFAGGWNAINKDINMTISGI